MLVGGNEQPAEWRPGLRSCSDHDSLVIDPVWAHCAGAEVDSVNEVYRNKGVRRSARWSGDLCC